MIIAALPPSALAQTPASAPTAAVAPADAAQPGSAIKRYFGCLREQTTFWRNDPAPMTHADSVMAACDALVDPAAAQIASLAAASPGFEKIADAYKTKHGAVLDLKPAAQRRLREQGRLGALHILSGDAGQQKVNLTINFDSDGVKP